MNEKWNFEKITDNIKNSIKSLREEVQKEWWFLKFLLKKLWLKRDQEVQETQTETQNNLNDLASDLIDDKIINLADEKISDEEKKVLEKIKELDKNDKYIENWLNWIDDIEDETLKVKEIQTLLSDLQKEADDGNKEWDLNDDEFKKIWKKANEKHTLCDNVLKQIERNNNIPEEKRTKKAILEAYNNWLTTETDIIKNLENSIEQSIEQKEQQSEQ